MMDEIEQRLQVLTPRPVTKSLRADVLAGVSATLSCETSSREVAARVTKDAHPGRSFSSTVWGCGVALMLVLGVGMNWWVNVSLDRRLAAILGPPPIQKQAAEIAQEVASVTNKQMGERTYDWLVRERARHNQNTTYFMRLDQLIQQLNSPAELGHETT